MKWVNDNLIRYCSSGFRSFPVLVGHSDLELLVNIGSLLDLVKWADVRSSVAKIGAGLWLHGNPRVLLQHILEVRLLE